MNWNELQELYVASKSDNERVRATAQAAIDANFPKWLEEYLSLPENCWDYDGRPRRASQDTKKGRPRFANYEELARWVTGWLMYESWEEHCKRCEELTADRLGILLRHRKHERARQLHANDWDFVTIFGDRYMLGLTPAVAPGDTAPQREEFVLP
jgi:hypothetical protein